MTTPLSTPGDLSRHSNPTPLHPQEATDMQETKPVKPVSYTHLTLPTKA